MSYTILTLANIEKPSRVVDGYDLDLFFSNPANEAIVAKKDLSDILHLQFRDDSSRTRVVSKAIGSTERSIGEHSSNLRRIASDKEADRLKVIESLRCPLYLSHLAIRWRAFS